MGDMGDMGEAKSAGIPDLGLAKNKDFNAGVKKH
jgi:hypothetical protein